MIFYRILVVSNKRNRFSKHLNKHMMSQLLISFAIEKCLGSQMKLDLQIKAQLVTK